MPGECACRGLEERQQPVAGCCRFAAVFVKSGEDEKNLSGGGCSVAALKKIEKFGRFGLLQCAEKFSAGGEIVAVAGGDEFGRKFFEKERQRAMERLEAVRPLGHDARFGRAKHSQTAGEGPDITTVDGFAKPIKFAKDGAVGGQSLQVVCGW
jgi:hypothetical protein